MTRTPRNPRKYRTRSKSNKTARTFCRSLAAAAGLALTLGAGAATAQSAYGAPGNPGGYIQPASSTSLDGAYAGVIDGVACQLMLAQQGERLVGGLQAQGYGYQLHFQPNGQGGYVGILLDPQTQGHVGAELVPTAQGLTLNLVAQDPATGQVQRVPLTFTRRAAGTTPTAQPTYGQPQPSYGQASQPQVQRDPVLAGRWRHTDTQVSGSFSMASDTWLEITPDGRFQMTSGGSGAGGSAGSITTGGGEVLATGQWMTRDRIVYVRDAGGAWEPYARYYVEDGTLMFTYANDSRELWYRR
ncbi:MAG: hypothetical protein AAF288_10735 [Planctomycetota bacterium]